MQKEEKEFLILLAKMFADSITKPKVIAKQKQKLANVTQSSNPTLAEDNKTKHPIPDCKL